MLSSRSDLVKGETLLLESGPFTPPTGNRDLDLVRDVILSGDTSAILDTGAPTLILTQTGAIDVQSTKGSAVDGQPGPGTLVTGAVTITVPDGTGIASFVAGVIGAEVPALTTDAVAPAPAPATGATGAATSAAHIPLDADNRTATAAADQLTDPHAPVDPNSTDYPDQPGPATRTVTASTTSPRPSSGATRSARR